jgi:hypothetical protein
VAELGPIEDGVLKIAKMLGWEDELKDLYKNSDYSKF